MKEAATHIATPVQNKTGSFFQRSAEEGKEDSAFFAGVQTKLTVGQKDDPFEQQADAMADKVVNLNPPNLQKKSEEPEQEEKEELQEEPTEITQKKAIAADDDNKDTLQRMCRECDEGDHIFRAAAGEPDVSGLSKRDGVIAMARSMLGKIKAKQAGAGGERTGAKELWEIFKLAAPGVWSEETVKTFGQPLPSWCGIFAVWAHKKAGIDLGNWQMGRGVTAFGTLKQTTSPQPGDIGYIDQPNQHHCIVTKLAGANIESIDGNSGLFSEVIENTRPLTAYTGFFTAFSAGDGGTVQKKEESGHAVPSSIESKLAATKSSGSPLPADTRTAMETGFNTDFSKVKIHTGGSAAELSHDLHAQAFTHGSDIYFNENKYDPGSASGKHLLAHELTHTVQQGQSIQKKGAPKKTDKYKTAIAKDDVDVDVTGNKYTITFKEGEKLKHEIDVGTKEIWIPKIALPGLKERNSLKFKWPVLSVRGRGETQQVENWSNAVKSAVNAKVAAFLLKAEKNEQGVYFLRLGGEKNFHLIGTLEQIQNGSYIPKWNRSGKPNSHQVDHVVEYQLGGDDQPGNKPENYELLDAKANVSSGRSIQIERYSRINESLGYFTEYNTNIDKGKFPNLPTEAGVRAEYLQSYAAIDNWKLPYNGDGKVYWTFEEISGGKHLEQLKEMTAKERKGVEGSADELLIYVSESLGTPKRLKIPFTKQVDNFFGGMDLTGIGDNSIDIKNGDKIKLTLNKQFSKRLKTDQALEFDLVKIEGRINTFYIKTTRAFNKNMFKKFEGLSPVTINELSLDMSYGLMLSGTIEADLPLLKGLLIDFFAEGSDYGFTALIGLDFIAKTFPKIFKVTNALLTLSYSSKDDVLGLAGAIAFEIEKLGKGEINASKKGKDFAVSGRFDFDKSILDGYLEVSYSSEAGWGIKGSAKILGGNKIKGVKGGQLGFSYAADIITVTGKASLALPGIKEIEVDARIGADGDFVITTKIQLDKIPHVKGGEGSLTIAKNKAGEWDLGFSGEVEPDIKFSGLTIKKVSLSYGKGIFDISADASYDRNRIHGDFKLGLTNKPVTAEGKLGEGEPTEKMTYYGALKLKVTIVDGENKIEGEIDSVLKPDGDITLDAKVVLDKDYKIFEVPPLNKNIFTLDKNIRLFSCIVVDLSLHIGGAIDLYAVIEPLTLKQGSNVRIGNLSLKNYSDPQISSTLTLGSHLKAGIKLMLELGLDASLLGIIHAGIGGKGSLDFVALDADATGIIDMGWSSSTGLQIKEASVSLDMTSKLIAELSAYARVYVDLWVTTITVWSHEWELDKEEMSIALFGKKKMTMPVMGSDNKLAPPKTEQNLSDVKGAADKDKIAERTQNKLDGKGQTEEDKQAEINDLVKTKVIELFTNPDRFIFNRSEDYLETRYSVYNYLVSKAGVDTKLDLSYLNEEIRKAEFEEYDAFTAFIMADTSFSNDSKSTIIEDFINNHPTLYAGEIVNLRSLIPVPVKNEKPPLKTRAAQKPKQTPNQQASAKSAPPVQRKKKNSADTKRALTHQSDIGMSGANEPLADMDTTVEGKGHEHDTDFKSVYMKPYSRMRRPLQQPSGERKSPFFSGPQKKEKTTDSSFFQAKLDVGSEEDQHEKEADTVADKVVSQGAKAGDSKGTGSPAAATGALPEEKKDKVAVQKKENPSAAPVAPAKTAEASIAEKNGTGNGLPADALHEMQGAFDRDFSDVNIHTDSESNSLANDLNAQAFTTGKDIYFNSGKFDPGSEPGKHLLAHELTHVVQQNGDTIRRAPQKDKDPEKDRAQSVRDNYQDALKKKVIDWQEVALYFNAFNAPEMQSKMAQLNGRQQFLLHQGAVYGTGVGPWSAAALHTNPLPGINSTVAAAIEENILHNNYQAAIDLFVKELDKMGVIDSRLLWGGTFHFLGSASMEGEGRILPPGFDQLTGKAKPAAANIGADAFGESKGLPFLYSTLIHEYQHVQQVQQQSDTKSKVAGQSDDKDAHLQQEVEAYGTELLLAKQTGLYNIPEQLEDTWNRLQQRWELLSDTRKQALKDLYKNAYAMAKEALGKKSFLVYTPVK